MVAIVSRMIEGLGGFLCLSRKSGESVYAIHEDGTTIEFQIGDVHSNRAGVRIRAPKNVRIIRGELLATAAPKRAA